MRIIHNGLRRDEADLGSQIYHRALVDTEYAKLHPYSRFPTTKPMYNFPLKPSDVVGEREEYTLTREWQEGWCTSEGGINYAKGADVYTWHPANGWHCADAGFVALARW